MFSSLIVCECYVLHFVIKISKFFLSTVYSRYEKDNENLNTTKHMEAILQQM